MNLRFSRKRNNVRKHLFLFKEEKINLNLKSYLINRSILNLKYLLRGDQFCSVPEKYLTLFEESLKQIQDFTEEVSERYSLTEEIMREDKIH